RTRRARAASPELGKAPTVPTWIRSSAASFRASVRRRTASRRARAAATARASLDLSSLGRTDRDRRRGHEPREKPARPVRAALLVARDARLSRFAAWTLRP